MANARGFDGAVRTCVPDSFLRTWVLLMVPFPNSKEWALRPQAQSRRNSKSSSQRDLRSSSQRSPCSQSVATITTQIASMENVVGGLAARVAALEAGALARIALSCHFAPDLLCDKTVTHDSFQRLLWHHCLWRESIIQGHHCLLVKSWAFLLTCLCSLAVTTEWYCIQLVFLCAPLPHETPPSRSVTQASARENVAWTFTRTYASSITVVRILSVLRVDTLTASLSSIVFLSARTEYYVSSWNHRRGRYLQGCSHRIAQTTRVGASQEQYLVSSLSRQDFGEMVLDVLDS